jgi:hypothetical protein
MMKRKMSWPLVLGVGEEQRWRRLRGGQTTTVR